MCVIIVIIERGKKCKENIWQRADKPPISQDAEIIIETSTNSDDDDNINDAMPETDSDDDFTIE